MREKLKRMTVENGCTEAEAATAKRLLEELSGSSSPRLRKFNYIRGLRRDWCGHSANEKAGDVAAPPAPV